MSAAPAGRGPGGRSLLAGVFKVVPGRPLATSYGEDLYQQVFGGAARGCRSRASYEPGQLRDQEPR